MARVGDSNEEWQKSYRVVPKCRYVISDEDRVVHNPEEVYEIIQPVTRASSPPPHAPLRDPRLKGGRGLPLSEIPSCPGRFVLSGTCCGPAGKKNTARSRHNVRTALAAFDALGGVRGVWLRSEEAILSGDHEVCIRKCEKRFLAR